MRRIPIVHPEHGQEGNVVVHNHGRLGVHVHAPPGFDGAAIARATTTAGARGETTVTVDLELR